MKAKAWPYADIKYPFSVDESGSFAEFLLEKPGDMQEIALGSRVLISDLRFDNEGNEKKIWMEATVVGIRAVSPFNLERENLLYVHDETLDSQLLLRELNGPHRIQKYLIRVRLNKEIEYDIDYKKFNLFPIQRPPSANSCLTFPSILPKIDEELEPSLAEMLEVKQVGIRVGAIGFGNYPYESINNEFLIYHLDLNSLDNKHMFIVGESGSGKTVLLKNLALEIKKFDTSNKVILFDVQGDLTQMFLPDLIESPESKGWQSRIDKHTKEDAIKSMKPFNLVIPVTKQGFDSKILSLKKLALNRGVKVFEVGLRLKDLNLPSEVEYLFRVTSEQVAMLLDEEVEFLKVNGKEDRIHIGNLEYLIKKNMNWPNSGKEFASSAGTVYYSSTGNAALRALKNLSNYFDFHDPSVSMDNDPLDCLREDGTTIVYLDHLNSDERLMWEMQVVKWLYDNKSDRSEQYYVFIDEAHQIVPAKPPAEGLKGTFDRLRGNFERLAREGRKFGINLILSTQSPNDLHEIVPNQCPTKFVMKIDPKNAQYAQLDRDLASIAARFGQGQFWFRSPFNGTMEWVRIHSWSSDLPHEPMVNFWRKLLEQAKKE